MASNFTAIYDACILYSAPLRDLLMQLALTDLFRARWTEQIHNEWMRNVLKNRPDLTLEQLTRTKELMNCLFCSDSTRFFSSVKRLKKNCCRE